MDYERNSVISEKIMAKSSLYLKGIIANAVVELNMYKIARVVGGSMSGGGMFWELWRTTMKIRGSTWVTNM